MAENRLPLGQCSFLPEIIKIKDDKFENAEIFLLQTGSAKRVHQRHHHHRYSTAAAGQNKKVHPGDKSTLPARSGTTVPNFSFFAELCMHC